MCQDLLRRRVAATPRHARLNAAIRLKSPMPGLFRSRRPDSNRVTPSLRAMVGTASIGSIRLRNTPPAPEFGLEAGLGRPELDTDLTRSTDSRRGAATFWLSSVSAIEALIADRDRRLSRTHALRHVGAVEETGIVPGRDVRISMPDELRHLDKSQAFRGIERYAAGRSRPSAPSRPRRTPSQSASASPWPCRRS